MPPENAKSENLNLARLPIPPRGHLIINDLQPTGCPKLLLADPTQDALPSGWKRKEHFSKHGKWRSFP
jgi:hypothetical protein